jgi:hypothetical protein
MKHVFQLLQVSWSLVGLVAKLGKIMCIYFLWFGHYPIQVRYFSPVTLLKMTIKI